MNRSATGTFRQARHGFALLAVLWIVITLGVLAAALGHAASLTVGSAQAEHDRLAGRWSAEGCVARAHAVVDAVLAEQPDRADTSWRRLDSIMSIDGSTAFSDCDLSLRPDGRLVISHVTEADLDSLPGMTPESVAKIVQLRDIGGSVEDLASIAEMLSPDARAIFQANFSAFVHRVTTNPDAWILRAQTHLGAPPTPVHIEARLVRAGGRAAVVRWVEW